MRWKPCAGSALVVVLWLLLLLTLLGAAALQMGQSEMEQTSRQAQRLRAVYLAESGIELTVGWLARPEQWPGGMSANGAGSCPDAPRAGAVLAKRCRRSTGRLSFTTDDGTSQFHGTAARPDGSVSLPAAPLFPDDAQAGGALVEVRLFGPLSRGAIATVRSIGRTAEGARHAVQAELSEVSMPALTAAVAVGAGGPTIESIRLYWGELRHEGAAPDDQEVWSYGELKSLARRFGLYYTSDESGRLRWNGAGAVLTPDEVFAARPAALPLLFIDTIDGQPPRSGPLSNLAPLTLSRSTGHGLSYIGGDLVLAPDESSGRTVSVPSPSADGGTVELPGVQFGGGFHVAGRIRVERESRLHGALYAAQGFDGAERLELWYDRRLGEGWLPGWPVVTTLPGSWHWIASDE